MPAKKPSKDVAARAQSKTASPTTEDVPASTQDQHPALSGDEKVETAQRTAGETPEDGRYHHRFVVQKDAAEGELTDERQMAAKLATSQYAIQNGLHPSEEPSFDGQSDHKDGHSVNLDYSVAVTPSIVDHNAADTVTPTAIKDAAVEADAPAGGSGEATEHQE